ncbi:hypothetical protein ACFX2I_003118 [Malus domestica]
MEQPEVGDSLVTFLDDPQPQPKESSVCIDFSNCSFRALIDLKLILFAITAAYQVCKCLSLFLLLDCSSCIGGLVDIVFLRVLCIISTREKTGNFKIVSNAYLS